MRKEFSVLPEKNLVGFGLLKNRGNRIFEMKGQPGGKYSQKQTANSRHRVPLLLQVKPGGTRLKWAPKGRKEELQCEAVGAQKPPFCHRIP